MSLLAVTERSIDVWVGPWESCRHWIMGCGAVSTYAAGQKCESKSLVLQSCSADVKLGF